MKFLFAAALAALLAPWPALDEEAREDERNEKAANESRRRGRELADRKREERRAQASAEKPNGAPNKRA